MNSFEAFTLGLIQGITEFFPISSSGHLKLCEYFFGYEDLGALMLFDLVCHLGTLLSIALVLRKELSKAFRDKNLMLDVFVALIPLFPLVFLLKELTDIFGQVELLGLFFLITAGILHLGQLARQRANYLEPTTKSALIVGISQAIAVMPGISRSGASISTAMLLGWEKNRAAIFSFILAIPTILGGFIYKSMQLMIQSEELVHIPLKIYFVGFFTSCLSGIIALFLLLKLIRLGKIAPFKWYCLILGLSTLIYFNL